MLFSIAMGFENRYLPENNIRGTSVFSLIPIAFVVYCLLILSTGFELPDFSFSKYMSIGYGQLPS